MSAPKVCGPFEDGNPFSVAAHRHANPDGTTGGWVAQTALVSGNAQVSGDAWVYGNARVYGNAWVYGNARVYGNALVSAPRHLLTLGPVGSEDQTVTLARTESGHLLTIGCWRNGTVDQLAAEVARRCPDRADEYAEIEAVLRRRVAEWEAER